MNSISKIDAIIQARLSSTRLPGKVLKQICGRELLGHVIDRVSSAKSIDRIIVATTTNVKDDELCDWLENENVIYFRGSENNVLDRFVETSKLFHCKHIARITPDDAFKDPEIIDKIAHTYFSENLDFAYNNYPPTFPEGLDIEIFSAKALYTVKLNTVNPFDCEHLTQYLYRRSDKFLQKNVSNDTDFSSYRWTIDTEEDLRMIRKVYAALYNNGNIFSWKEVLNFLIANPEIADINSKVKRSHHYRKEFLNV